VVTGIGPISAVGCGKAGFWKGLLEGRTGFGPITLFDPSDSPSKIAAEVVDFDLGNYVERGRALSRVHPRPVQFGRAAAQLALEDAGLEAHADREGMGLAVGTSLANFDVTIRSLAKHLETGVITPYASFQIFHHNIACALTSALDVRGPCHTLSMGCNSGLDAIGFALRQIQVGAVDRMLAIGTDCEVQPGIEAALNASGSLATRYNDRPAIASRPFDRDRDGNVIGEGAAGLVLEEEESARARGARIYARLSGYSVRSAGRGRRYSPDAPELDISPSVAAMRDATAQAELSGGPSLVSANGSSSVFYDLLESRALATFLDDDYSRTPVHSIKSMLGQHGAGSSALQCSAACLSLSEGLVPGTPNCDSLDPECGQMNLVRATHRLAPTSVLVHAIGFGGFYYSAGVFKAA
jgi:3-oxoacyl-(acyl-carrier-protein) synthase